MKRLQYTLPMPKVSSVHEFSGVKAESKNSSLSIGGGYSQSGGWNGNITFTKKW